MSKVCIVSPMAHAMIRNINSEGLVGGAELQVTLIARGLAELGHSVSFITMGEDPGKVESIEGVEVYTAFNEFSGIKFFKSLYRAFTVWRAMSKSGANIFYQRSAGFYTGIVGLYCFFLRKRFLFSSASDGDFHDPVPSLNSSLDRVMYQIGIKLSDHFLVQTEKQSELAYSKFGKVSTVVRNIYTEAEASHSVPDYFLWVSNISKVKRPLLYIKLAEEIPECKFLMVGGVRDKDLFEMVRIKSEELDNLTFLGGVPINKVSNLITGAAALINTSSIEGFPNTFLQAWAKGIPVLSLFDCGIGNNDFYNYLENEQELIDFVKGFREEYMVKPRSLKAIDYVKKNHSSKTVLSQLERCF